MNASLEQQLLPPRSKPAQRIWCIGSQRSSLEVDRRPADLWLTVRPDDHATFSSLGAILDQLADLAQPEQRWELTRLRGYLREACPEPYAGAPTSHGRLLADSVAFAIMRRISRESFYTARVIDLGARWLNEVLCRIPGCLRVHVNAVDRLDRPSLKAFTRAVLLLEPRHSFSWVWHSASDPLGPSQEQGDEDLFGASRQQLLRQFVGLLAPTLVQKGETELLRSPPGHAVAVSTYQVSAALVMQNYDACFLWTSPSRTGGNGPEVAEHLRLLALAMVNIGKSREALKLLRSAEARADLASRRAHLCYLQGLIEAKRGYDLAASNRHYERGLTALGRGRQEEDLPLERAWLLNGLALNEALLGRRNGDGGRHFARAFALEREAFDLVAEGDDPARSYLRFNLLANSAFLMEIQGNYKLAIDTLEKTFTVETEDASDRKERWHSTLAYRIGVLHFRAGALEPGRRYLLDAAQQDAHTENWATQERILRALGLIEFDLGKAEQAVATFSRGLHLCREARFAEGVREHGRGLAASLLALGEKPRAQQLLDRLASEEGLVLLPAVAPSSLYDPGALRPSLPSPKLPAYFPEIDLEGMPAADLNRFLGKAPLQTALTRIPWRD